MRAAIAHLKRKRALATLALAMCAGTLAGAELDLTKLPSPASVQISFPGHIQPIFEKSCIRCHGAERPKGKFSLVNRDAALKGGSSGVAIVPGDSASSPLIHFVAGLVEDMEMPPSGKADPLSPEEIALLRTWIDQGAQWGVTAEQATPPFSIAPSLRWTSVSGDEPRFREHFWRKEGFSPGVEEFSIHEQTGSDESFTVEGRAFPVDDDYRFTIRYDRRDMAFVHAGFEHYRKYYDNSGGYYPGFGQPFYSLDRELHLNIGRLWIDVGFVVPDRPKMVLGYEYQFREGAKSTLQWGTVRQTSAPILPITSVDRNIYPAFKELNEETHILKFDLSHEVDGLFVENNLRAEFYDVQTERQNVTSIIDGQSQPTLFVLVNEAHDEVRLANTFRLEKELRDWWFVAGGYLFSKSDADASFRQTTEHITGLPVSGDFWNSHSIIFQQDAHVLNFNTRLGPWNDFVAFAGIQSEWFHQEGLGRVSFDTGNPATFLLLQPATLEANLDKHSLQEKVGLRFSGIPFTSMFAEAQFEQTDIGQFEEQIGGPHDFLRDTDATEDVRDYRAGLHVSQWQNVSWTGQYKHREKRNDYDHRVDLESGGQNHSYPAFIRARSTDSDEFETKVNIRPARWAKVTLSYERVSTGIDSETDDISGVTPGGTLRAADLRSDVFGLNLVLTPLPRWYFSGTLRYYDSEMDASHNNVPSVVPYKGDVWSALANVTYLLSEATDLNASYSWSKADYAQNNFASGLPVGINYDLHHLQAGVTHRFRKGVTANLQYAYYNYAEPTSGGFNDYSAHAIFATMSLHWR